MSSYPYDHNRGRNGHAQASSNNSFNSQKHYNNSHGGWSSSSTQQQHFSQGAPSHAPSSNSRWKPPVINTHSDMDTSTGTIGSSSTYNNKSRWSKSNSSGQHGGGKAKKRRNKSNDIKHNQYSRPRPHKKKNIISPDSATGNPQSADNNTHEAIPKLDPNDPANKNKIFQRRKQINFGKNTTGYEEYIKKIPKHKRPKRNAECPMTPDYLLDVPTKRFQGLMNAWRRALHKYDPADLHLRQPAQNTITLAPKPIMNEEDKQNEEIIKAKASGLQVAFGTMAVGKEAGMFSFNVSGEEETKANADGDDGNAFDEEAAYRQNMGAGIGLEADIESDSDDDLL